MARYASAAESAANASHRKLRNGILRGAGDYTAVHARAQFARSAPTMKSAAILVRFKTRLHALPAEVSF
jgi:hypothetical protein